MSDTTGTPATPDTAAATDTSAAIDPYAPGELDLHLIGEGRHEELWRVLGAQVSPVKSSSTARRR